MCQRGGRCSHKQHLPWTDLQSCGENASIACNPNVLLEARLACQKAGRYSTKALVATHLGQAEQRQPSSQQETSLGHAYRDQGRDRTSILNTQAIGKGSSAYKKPFSVTPLELAFRRRPAELVQLPTDATSVPRGRQSEDARQDLASRLRLSSKRAATGEIFFGVKKPIKPDGPKGGMWSKGKAISTVDEDKASKRPEGKPRPRHPKMTWRPRQIFRQKAAHVLRARQLQLCD